MINKKYVNFYRKQLRNKIDNIFHKKMTIFASKKPKVLDEKEVQKNMF